MQSASGSNFSANDPRDLFFNCQHCGVALVVDEAAAGMMLECQRCGKATVAPAAGKASDGSASGGQESLPLADLQRQLKENESQRTEVSGYINQLNIQLHRWQLRLQTLETRSKELAAKIASLQTPV